MILIENKRTKEETLKEKYPGAQIIDVTSKSKNEFVRLSPFFPIGGIPVPFSPDEEAETVEGIWQALKVFENEGVDTNKLYIRKDCIPRNCWVTSMHARRSMCHPTTGCSKIVAGILYCESRRCA